MATKPTVAPRVWDSSGVYTTGPFIGSISRVDPGAGIAAEGHRPGSAFPTPAEYENYQQFRITSLVTNWLFLGSSTGAADAHVVETDAAGHTSLVGLTLNDAVNHTVLNVTGVSAAAPIALFTGTAGGPVVQANIGTSAAIAFSTSVGVGAGTGLDVSLIASPAGATGVNVTCDATTVGPGIKVTTSSITNGTCIIATSVGPAPVIDVVQSGAQAGTGVRITGGSICLDIDPSVVSSPSGTGAIIRSGTTGSNSAIEAILLNNDGWALDAITPVASTSSARALNAFARGAAVAVDATSVNGTAVIATATNAAAVIATATGFVAVTAVSNGSGAAGNYAATLTGDTTAPLRGVVLMTPQNADPSGGGVTGALAMSTAKGLTGGNFADGTWRSYWHSLKGYACAFDLMTNRSTAGAGYVLLGTITTAADGDQIKVANSVILLRASMSVRGQTATDSVLNIRVTDTTAAVVVFERSAAGGGDIAGYTVPGFLAPNNYWVPGPVFTLPVTVPLVGTRTYIIEIGAPTGNNVRVRDVVMDFVGTVA